MGRSQSNICCFLNIVLVLLFLPMLVEAQSRWDWHIGGGMVVDGTGRSAFRADILIRGDSIGYVGRVNPDTIQADHFVDAYRKKVTPGFIDVHAHGDPRSTPEFQNFLAMGVTTILLGQDGSLPGEGNMAEWFNQVALARPAVNVAALSGHGSLRAWSGAGNNKATLQEINRMTELLKSDLEAGAWGMSTGLEYVPGLYAGREELMRLAEVVGRYDGIIMSHMRSEENSQIKESLDELAAQGGYARVHASHLKVIYGNGADKAEEILEYIAAYQDQGIEFSADTYPYSASYTGLSIVFPEWARTDKQWQQALSERPEELRAFLQEIIMRRNGPEAVLFGSGQYRGKTLEEVADMKGRPFVEVLMEMGPQGASAAYFVMDEELQDRIAVDPDVMISSDGSPTMHHPRGYGSFAKVIRKYVVEQQALTLEEAVHKMSGLPANTLGLQKRGIIREGYKADILIFRTAEVRDTATFEHPHRLAKGFSWVWVNGQLVRKNGQFTGLRPGKVLKKMQSR